MGIGPRVFLVSAWFAVSTLAASAQPLPDQPSIYFPQAPQPGQWRSSVGMVFTTTPPEITEEIRITIPAIDVNLQRGLSKRLYIISRLQTQFVQSNLTLGLRWATPLNDRLHLSVGDDVSGWFGALRLKDVFNSQAYGLVNYPNASVGYRLTRDLQLAVRAEAIIDWYYRSQVGSVAVEYKPRTVNGAALTFVLEQPFYNRRHVTLGLRAVYADFNWQFWSLYETFDRNLFYPQLLFGFIL